MGEAPTASLILTVPLPHALQLSRAGNHGPKLPLPPKPRPSATMTLQAFRAFFLQR